MLTSITVSSTCSVIPHKPNFNFTTSPFGLPSRLLPFYQPLHIIPEIILSRFFLSLY